MRAVISRCEVIKPLIVRRETSRRAIFEHGLLKQLRLRIQASALHKMQQNFIESLWPRHVVLKIL